MKTMQGLDSRELCRSDSICLRDNRTNRKGNYMKKDLISYSMQLSMLKKLLIHKLISKEEYTKIKEGLMKDYKIVSDITA